MQTQFVAVPASLPVPGRLSVNLHERVPHGHIRSPGLQEHSLESPSGSSASRCRRPLAEAECGARLEDDQAPSTDQQIAIHRRLHRLALRAFLAIGFVDAERCLTAADAFRFEYARVSHLELPDSAHLHNVLLLAASSFLTGDSERAVLELSSVANIFDAASSDVAAISFLRFAHWKAGRHAGFDDTLPLGSLNRSSRKTDLLKIFHLAMDAAVAFERLQLSTAQRLASEAIHLSRLRPGRASLGALWAVNISARILYEHGDLCGAERLLSHRQLPLDARWGLDAALHSLVTISRIASATQRPAYAMLLLHEAVALSQRCAWPRLASVSLGERIRLLVNMGMIEEAELLAQRFSVTWGHEKTGTTQSALQMDQLLAQARIDHSKGSMSDATIALCKTAFDGAPGCDCFTRIEVWLLAACILLQDGRREDAEQIAHRAIRIGADRGVYRTFLDSGKAVQDLLAWLYGRRTRHGRHILGEHTSFVRSLLAPSRPPAVDGLPTVSKRRPGQSLSPRERDILSSMGKGLSNKVIARELEIAPETVKSHAKRILLKLASQSRTEAVSRAMRLGII